MSPLVPIAIRLLLWTSLFVLSRRVLVALVGAGTAWRFGRAARAIARVAGRVLLLPARVAVTLVRLHLTRGRPTVRVPASRLIVRAASHTGPHDHNFFHGPAGGRR